MTFSDINDACEIENLAGKYPIKSFLYIFFLRTAEKPGFFLQGRRIMPEKKAGFLPRANIKNLWLGTGVMKMFPRL
ncbi:Uncharacterized protein dnm_058890 [Desulfonema magnum]|uniref:Uncharacterized protein n=1 Tax=Desulfonema magnum TaxID=45655 RepID=A0A975GQG0_9BACT|nr:Uncharacterized protein dnm_058890 [Desulfonema magnum]